MTLLSRFNRSFSVKCIFTLLFTVLFMQTAYAGHAGSYNTTARQDAFYTIIKKGELRVGISEVAPWVMKDRHGKLIGFEIDIARQLAHDMGVKLVFKQYEWNRLIPALLKGKIDLIASGMSITPQRSLKVDFSHPYESSGYSLVSNLKLTKDFTSISDLNNKNVTITAVKGTVSAELARKIFPKASLELKNTAKEASAAVVKGQAHAFVASSPIPEFTTSQYPEKCDMPLSKPLLKTREAFAVNKGNQELLNYLNSWIVAHNADGWIRSTHKYWFKTLQWQHDVKKE